MRQRYQQTAADVQRELGTDIARGLRKAETQDRLRQYGPNELIEAARKSTWRILWEQLSAMMVAILIAAAAISAFMRDWEDTGVIVAIVVLNALLGFTQEARAERAMAALQRLAIPLVKVRRDGQLHEILAREIVPGDLVLLEAGNIVPADARIVESANLHVDEAALTGESMPVEKHADALIDGDVPLADRHNMLYRGTIVTYGRGVAIVTATGMRTELGRIAALLQSIRPETTPLQRRLDQVGRTLAVIALVIIGVIVALGLLRGEAIPTLLLTAISMAVAAVPEGLPAVVTIALALGAQRMLHRRALIRKLAAVETLGAVTVICADKTGTLTENRMAVTILDVAGYQLDLTTTTEPYPPVRATRDDGEPGRGQPALAVLLTGIVLCNNGQIQADDQSASAWTVGDPTEVALLVAAQRHAVHQADLLPLFPRVAELPFDSQRKRMTTVHTTSRPIPDESVLAPVWDSMPGINHAPFVAFTKGAVDRLLQVSSAVLDHEQIVSLNPARLQRITAAHDRLAQQGMRVLGLALRPLAALPSDNELDTIEHGLIFVGMVGMRDPARVEVRAAVATCRAAGIRPVMITGDHPLTAQAIARDVGIMEHGSPLTGAELERMSATELQAVVDDVAVYARVAPEHKLKIMQALQARGEIVAMTGDGVNDAPALKQADIGVAMGIGGADVAKEAADMVLLDDNFATIVAAIDEGRVIYDNIRKFLRYLMTTNSAELWVMLLAPLLGMPLPLLPVQILWINLVTDGLPALALSVEPGERARMQRPPRSPAERLFARGLGRHVVWVGVLMSVLVLSLSWVYWRAGSGAWQTLAFTTLTFAQMAHVLAIRSERDSLFTIGVRSNLPLLGAVIMTVALQLAVVYLPFAQRVFATVSLTLTDLLFSVAVSAVVFAAVELEKWLTRRKQPASLLARRPYTSR